MTTNQINTKVGLIGVEPAGLIIANILQKYNISCVVIAKNSESEIYARSDTDLLDSQTITILKKYCLSDRLLEIGIPHFQSEFRTPTTSFMLDYAQMSNGQTNYVYPRQKLLVDLMQKFLQAGGEILFNAQEITIANNSHGATIQCQHYHKTIVVNCDFIVGCDGLNGVARSSIPASILQTRLKEYDYAWLAITAEVLSFTNHSIYGIHPRGFAGGVATHTSESTSCYYLQIPMGDSADDWSSDRIWSELELRLDKDGWTLARGKITAKEVLKINSCITQKMQHHRLFLAGDAAHTWTPVAHKGVNLGIQDADVLGESLVSFYHYHDNLPLKQYSAIRFAAICQAQEFSESLLHMLNIQDDNSPEMQSRQRLQQFKLAQLINSEIYAISFARKYVGYVPNLKLIAKPQPKTKEIESIAPLKPLIIV